MKKFLIFVFMAAAPVYAMCSIDIEESVCSLPKFREQVPLTYGTENLGNPDIDNPAPKLQPLKREDPINQMRGPNNDLNYNSGCQFGNCLQNPNKSKLPE